MNHVENVFVRSMLGGALVATAGGGCASEPVAGNDLSKWEQPDVDTSDPYRMSVERLRELESGTPLSPPLQDWSSATTNRIAREQAGMYIAGVLDGGEQRQWCVAQSGVPPHEVDQVLVRALAEAPGDDNAAAALRKAAETRFPCRPSTSVLNGVERQSSQGARP